ncbi:uncharacterized protein LOC143593352 [Bidens hawaiensis]|uniref:uncharacterized protein LOC143593352 n=1 Tax=Bidens hawaiensis TaxID=980011 RepID=UPI0040497BFC
MDQITAILKLMQNEDFNTMSHFAVVNNDDVDDVLEDGIEDDDDDDEDIDDVLEDDETGDEAHRIADETSHGNVQVPSTYTNLEETNLNVESNWMISHTVSKNYFTSELGKDSFDDKEEFIRAVKLYHIKSHKHFKVIESKPTTWCIICKLHEQGCKWHVRASKRKRSGSFEITRYIGPHTCLHYKITQDHPNLDATLIAQEIEHLIKEQPSISNTALRAEIIDKLGYTPSYKKVWVGKQKAIEHVFGNWEQSYILLPKFLNALRKFNPRTIVEWCVMRPTNDQVEFRRVFWAFDPCIKGFKHCRPVISIDATHLYGKYKGKMMIAMGVDGNNQILPLAFAIVENESYPSWNWFLSHVKKHVVKDIEGVCLIFDRHAGILKAINEEGSPWLEPRGFHSNSYHFVFQQISLSCWKSKSNSKVLLYYGRNWTINLQALQWLEDHALDKWTLAHDGGKRYGLLTTNLSEIFNSVLKGARFLPITSCVQLTFYRLVNYFEVRRPMGSSAQANGDVYTPHVAAKQAALMSKAGEHSLKIFNRQKGIVEVITQKEKNVQVVNLEQRTCSCGKWEIFKYPCSHVLSVYAKLSLNNWQYINKCYSIVDYCATWSSEFFPIPHEAYWPQSPSIRLLPNLDLKRDKKGRPRSTRLRNGMDIKEGKSGNRCGICGERGHNRSTCPFKPRRIDV